MKLTDVIRRPLITEKTSILRERDGRTIVFEVATHANKTEIKRAIETLLGSKVEHVRTAIAHGKVKRQGRFAGQRSDWKKAYVKLREGEKLPEFFEGAYRHHNGCRFRTYKPTSPGRRFQTVQTFDDMTTSKPHKPLVENLHRRAAATIMAS